MRMQFEHSAQTRSIGVSATLEMMEASEDSLVYSRSFMPQTN